VFYGRASVNVDFATGQVSVTIEDTATYDGTETPVPAGFTTVAMAGAADSDLANYLTGPASSGAMTGGVGGRYFGPVVTAGTSGEGPTELGGAFSMSNSATGQAVIGGFITLKQ
jgi:hypothetical protein